MGAKAKVLDSLARVLGPPEKDNVGTSGCADGELIEGETLTTSLLDARAGSGGEAERTDAQLGHLEEAVVIGDSTNNSANLALVCVLAVLVGRNGHNLGDRHWWSVDARHAQSVSCQTSLVPTPS